MRGFLAGAVLTSLVLTSLALPVSAEPSQPASPDAAAKYGLAWVRDDGAESCPAERDFADEVTRRLARSPFDERAERTIEIRIERDGDAYRSRVTVRERDGRVAGRRALSSPGDCAELFSATALAVALLIDPEATLHADANASRAVAAFELAEPPAPPRAAPAPVVLPAPAPLALPSPAAEPARPYDLGGASANAALGIGLVPGVVPGAELLVRKRLRAHFGLSATALYLASGDASTAGTTFGVGLTAFSLSGLYEAIEARDFSAGLELGLWGGALRASVQSVPTMPGTTVGPSDAGDHPFFAADLGLHARVRLAGPVFLEARALGLVPFIRRKLELAAAVNDAPYTPAEANTVVWTAPPVAALGTLGLGVRFP
ncbi:MAG TPA: hypothetical protein VGQ57_07740 [Polyangiaceae bacterium]|jgi:hypothetical protein|nr:hypothetical protein [Polyangiaceae bacterium]